MKIVIWFIKKPVRSDKKKLYFYVPAKYYNKLDPDKEYLVIIKGPIEKPSDVAELLKEE